MRNKCVVAHAGARDHYQLALALAEKGYLEKLVTDIYTPNWLYSIFPSIFEKRYQPGLSSSFISFNILNLSLGILNILIKKKFDHRKNDESISIKAYSIASKKQLALFLYSYYAFPAFKKAQSENFNQPRLLFQLHPHPLSVRNQLQLELENYPQAADSLLNEAEMKYSSDYFQRLSDEPSLADAIVVASSYTKATLVEHNIPAEIIKVVPYGVDLQNFKTRTIAPKNNKLRVLFVGSMVQRKGLTYLFEAIAKLPKGSTELVLCGRGFVDHNLLKGYSSSDTIVQLNLDNSSLVAEMHKADVFVLPSLSEGFGHVILEAMATGLPIIATNHTSAPDLITDGEEGWVIPIRDTKAIVERLNWCIENKNLLFNMGMKAAATAKQFTWERFRAGIVDFYETQIH
jgi:glycosyltransferase involved in cell wall biosynthesis